MTPSFVSLTFLLSSVRTTSIIAVRACITDWNIIQSIILQCNYVGKVFKFILLHNFFTIWQLHVLYKAWSAYFLNIPVVNMGAPFLLQKVGSQVFEEKDEAIWTWNNWQPLISAEKCTLLVSYCCTFPAPLFDISSTVSYCHGTSLQKTCLISVHLLFQKMECRWFLKNGAPLFGKQSYELESFANVISSMNSVWKTSIMTGRACTIVRNVIQSTPVLFNYAEKLAVHNVPLF